MADGTWHATHPSKIQAKPEKVTPLGGPIYAAASGGKLNDQKFEGISGGRGPGGQVWNPKATRARRPKVL
eukprot:scaffold78179_cov29-Tisochrysis_lutea.AAC.4